MSPRRTAPLTAVGGRELLVAVIDARAEVDHARHALEAAQDALANVPLGIITQALDAIAIALYQAKKAHVLLGTTMHRIPDIGPVIR